MLSAAHDSDMSRSFRRAADHLLQRPPPERQHKVPPPWSRRYYEQVVAGSLRCRSIRYSRGTMPDGIHACALKHKLTGPLKHKQELVICICRELDMKNWSYRIMA